MVGIIPTHRGTLGTRPLSRELIQSGSEQCQPQVKTRPGCVWRASVLATGLSTLEPTLLLSTIESAQPVEPSINVGAAAAAITSWIHEAQRYR